MASNRYPRPSFPVSLAFCLACLAQSLLGCQGAVSLLAAEHLDESTGMTFSSATEPMVFAREAGQYSRSARDYLYLGPLETNRQGTREYFLWVGVATTLDRGYLAPTSEAPDVLYIFVRGELMEFKLIPWSESIPSPDATRVYGTKVDLQTQYVARVTVDQLELFAASQIDAIQLGRADGPTQRYSLWQTNQSWGNFLRLVAESASPVSVRESVR